VPSGPGCNRRKIIKGFSPCGIFLIKPAPQHTFAYPIPINARTFSSVPCHMPHAHRAMVRRPLASTHSQTPRPLRKSITGVGIPISRIGPDTQLTFGTTAGIAIAIFHHESSVTGAMFHVISTESPRPTLP